MLTTALGMMRCRRGRLCNFMRATMTSRTAKCKRKKEIVGNRKNQILLAMVQVVFDARTGWLDTYLLRDQLATTTYLLGTGMDSRGWRNDCSREVLLAAVGQERTYADIPLSRP